MIVVRLFAVVEWLGWLGLVMIGAGCANPLPPAANESDDSGTDETGPGGDDSATDDDIGETGPGAEGSGTDPTAGTDPDTGTETGTDTNGGGGFCGYACAGASDCPNGGMGYVCNAGVCEYQYPPCDNTTCPEAAGGMCSTLGGIELCTFPCPAGDECDALMLECGLEDDEGTPICGSEPEPCGGVAEGEACEIEGFGQIGVCTDGLCSCSADTECTAADQTCIL